MQSLLKRCICLAMVALLGSAQPFGWELRTPSALADDGDGGDDGGDDGGGGGGAGGGGGDASGGPSSGWKPFGGNRPSASTRCTCVFFVCSCKRAARQPRQRQAEPRRADSARPREIVVVGLSDSEFDRLIADGFRVGGRTRSGLLGGTVARLQVPSRLSNARALARVRSAAPGAQAARNDVYPRTAVRSYRTAGQSCGKSCQHFDVTGWVEGLGRCSRNVTIGVIDTGVDREHPALRSARIEVRVTRRDDRPPSPADHGTGVVSLIAGGEDSPVVGLAREARILAADAFHAVGSGSQADTFDLIASLDWMADERVQVVNMSLSGPDNDLLKRAVEQMNARGILLIAAAGMPGSGRSQGFPGRYDGVVAVSAVDARLRPSRLSSRGDHIAFAAPGVGLVVAGAGGELRQVDGTSFAAPFLTSAYAIALAGGKPADEATWLLSGTAKDLGAPGRDKVFGWGVVQYAGLPRC